MWAVTRHRNRRGALASTSGFVPREGARVRCTTGRMRNRPVSPIVLVLGFVLALGACSRGGPERDWVIAESGDLSSRIDALFTGYDAPESPGGIAAVIHQGRIVHLNGYGSANREFQIPWTPYVAYRIASITKGFTGQATLLLADAGGLDLDDPVQQHLTDFPTFPAPLTIRHLLTNTSGLWYDEWLLPLAGVTGHATLDEMYALARRQDTLNYVPGTAHNYIDTNWRMMARIIETVTGVSWQEALRELIFAPLGMDRTLAPPDIAQIYDGQGTTYLYAGEGVTSFRFEFPFQTSGDGSMLTTFDDFLRWPMHLREGFEDGASMFDRLKGPTRLANGSDLAYGFGLGEERHRSLRGWGHGGATGTHWAFYPEIDLIVAVFSNYLGALSAAALHTQMVDAFLASDLGSGYSVPGGMGPAPLTPEQQQLLAGTFVDPETGDYLRSRGQPGSLTHQFSGAPAPLQDLGECTFQTVRNVHIPPIEVIAPDCDSAPPTELQVHWSAWDSPRRFVRVQAGDAGAGPSHPSANYVGRYYSDQLRVHWHVESEERGLTMRIGAGVRSGQNFDLVATSPDAFIAEPHQPPMLDLLSLPPVAIKFERDGSGRVSTLHVSLDRIRGVHFTRR